MSYASSHYINLFEYILTILLKSYALVLGIIAFPIVSIMIVSLFFPQPVIIAGIMAGIFVYLGTSVKKLQIDDLGFLRFGKFSWKKFVYTHIFSIIIINILLKQAEIEFNVENIFLIFSQLSSYANEIYQAIEAYISIDLSLGERATILYVLEYLVAISTTVYLIKSLFYYLLSGFLSSVFSLFLVFVIALKM